MNASNVKSSIELFEHGVLRCANWPMETLQPFGAPELASLALQLHSLALSIVVRQKLLGFQLYNEIPGVDSLSVRRELLGIRRAIRSGLFPYDSLVENLEGIDFRSRELRQLIESDLEERRAYTKLRTELFAAYTQELERERSVLHRLTGDIQFQCALSLANPELAKRWRHELENLRQLMPDEKSARRQKQSKIVKTEASILSYLFRAVTRPTPGGLWAGVASIYLDRQALSQRDIEIIPVKPRLMTTINLEVFERVVGGLRKQERYRTSPTIRLAATVHRVRELWWYQTRAQPKHEWTRVPEVAHGASILNFFADGRPHDPNRVVQQLARTSATDDKYELSHRSLTESITSLVNEEVLVSTLSIPQAPQDCWEALHEVGKQLATPDQGFWLSTVQSIRRLCDDVSKQLGESPGEGVDGLTDAIKAHILKLYEWAGLAEPLPTPLILVDTKLGFNVRCSTRFWDALRDSVRELLAFYESHGVAEQLRRVTLETLLGNNKAGVHLPFLEMVRSRGAALELSDDHNDGARALKQRLEKDVLARQYFWYEQLLLNKSSDTEIVPAAMCGGKPRAGFDGTVLLSVLSGPRIRAEWGRPHALSVTSRLAPLLNESGEFPLAQAISEWYRTWTIKGFEPVEIAGSDSPNHNATTRQRLTVDRILADGSEIRLSDLVIESAPGVIRPWLRHTISGKKMMPVYNCTGVIGASDASSQSLYRLALSHGWEFVCRRLFPGWVREKLPSLTLPGGTVVSPQRWFLTGAEIESLSKLDEAERYVKWIATTKRLGMPEKVMVAFEPTPDVTLVYLPITSPLAVRSLFARVARQPRALEFTEIHGDTAQFLIVDEDGKHYASEIIVAWKDPTYPECVFNDHAD